jgi:hypothetical protein
MRWKRQAILASVALVTFFAAPIANSVDWRYEPLHAREQLCRQMAKTMQVAMPLSSNPAALEARLWEPNRRHCGEWRSYLRSGVSG